MSEVVRATVITDASYCMESRAGGWAAWINVNYPNGDHVRLKHHGTFKFRAANSEHAEQMAAMNGIWVAYAKGATDILLQTDCLNLVNTHGSGRAKGLEDYRMAATLHWPHAKVLWKHVKAHNLKNVNDRRTWVNDWCDKMAKRHMRAQRDGRAVDKHIGV